MEVCDLTEVNTLRLQCAKWWDGNKVQCYWKSNTSQRTSSGQRPARQFGANSSATTKLWKKTPSQRLHDEDPDSNKCNLDQMGAPSTASTEGSGADFVAKERRNRLHSFRNFVISHRKARNLQWSADTEIREVAFDFVALKPQFGRPFLIWATIILILRGTAKNQAILHMKRNTTSPFSNILGDQPPHIY